VASPHGLPWIVAGCVRPTGAPGTASRPTSPSARSSSRRPTRCTTPGGGATPGWRTNFGDLLLQVVLHAQHAAERGVFDLSMSTVHRRQDRAPPSHVFGDTEAPPSGRSSGTGSRSSGERAASVPSGSGGLAAAMERRWRRIPGRTRSRTRARAQAPAWRRGGSEAFRASPGRFPRSPTPRRCRVGPPPSGTTGPTSRGHREGRGGGGRAARREDDATAPRSTATFCCPGEPGTQAER